MGIRSDYSGLFSQLALESSDSPNIALSNHRIQLLILLQSVLSLLLLGERSLEMTLVVLLNQFLSR